MGIYKEFREFALKGNVVDLAVGVIIGAAFGKVVSSLVADIVMPPLGLAIGGVNFSHLKLTLARASGTNPAVTLNYGAFLQALLDFVIVAGAVFLLVKGMNRLKRRLALEPAPPVVVPVSKEAELLTEIRDALKTPRG